MSANNLYICRTEWSAYFDHAVIAINKQLSCLDEPHRANTVLMFQDRIRNMIDRMKEIDRPIANDLTGLLYCINSCERRLWEAAELVNAHPALDRGISPDIMAIMRETLH